MPLQAIQFRLPKHFHDGLQAAADDSNLSMGRLLSRYIEATDTETISHVITSRIERGEGYAPSDFKTQLLVTPKAKDRVKGVADVTGLPSDFLIRLILEAHLKKQLQPHNNEKT